jgi:DeoR/GlpR family transcriptional regulator of sugar metabolism
MLLTEERRALILDRLRTDGKVRAAELVDELGVSHDTVRRDLQELAAAGVLRRVHGGALPAAVGSAPYAVRETQAVEAKRAIADGAIGCLRPGQVVFLDGGTTPLEVARRLPPELAVTIVTNSPPVAVALAAHPSAEVVLAGGTLSKDAVACVGAATVEAIASVRADVCVLGVCSLHPDVGITIDDLEERYVKRAMIAGAAEVVAVAAAEKLGSAATYVVAPLSELTHLVTEASVDEAQLEPYRALGLEVVRV